MLRIWWKRLARGISVNYLRINRSSNARRSPAPVTVSRWCLARKRAASWWAKSLLLGHRVARTCDPRGAYHFDWPPSEEDVGEITGDNRGAVNPGAATTGRTHLLRAHPSARIPTHRAPTSKQRCRFMSGSVPFLRDRPGDCGRDDSRSGALPELVAARPS